MKKEIITTLNAPAPRGLTIKLLSRVIRFISQDRFL